MIEISLDLIPLGIFEGSKLGRIKINNLGTHPDHPRRGNYKAEFYTKTGKLRKTVYVNDFPRKSKDVFDLLHLALIEYKK
jgi:hypothetical protein